MTWCTETNTTRISTIEIFTVCEMMIRNVTDKQPILLVGTASGTLPGDVKGYIRCDVILKDTGFVVRTSNDG
jgi:hypothetical protein